MKPRQLDHHEVLAIQNRIIRGPEITLLLDDVRTPENIAGIFRLADIFAVTTVYIFTESLLQFSKKFASIARIKADKIQHSFLDYQACLDTIRSHRERHDQVIGLDYTSSSTSISELEATDQVFLIVGSERNGVRDEFLQLCTSTTHIPMYGTISSLNVQQALAIALHELRR